jgi:hypothetical protein
MTMVMISCGGCEMEMDYLYTHTVVPDLTGGRGLIVDEQRHLAASLAPVALLLLLMTTMCRPTANTLTLLPLVTTRAHHHLFGATMGAL